MEEEEEEEEGWVDGIEYTLLIRSFQSVKPNPIIFVVAYVYYIGKGWVGSVGYVNKRLFEIGLGTCLV